MFTTLLLYQCGYDLKYLFELSVYYNKHRDDYFRALSTADASDEHLDWLIFFFGGFAYHIVLIQDLARSGAISATI